MRFLLCSHLRVEVIYFTASQLLLLAALQQLIVHPAQFSAWQAGLDDSASIEKVIDQNELRISYNYYMMTPKRLRRKKVFRNKDRGRW